MVPTRVGDYFRKIVGISEGGKNSTYWHDDADGGQSAGTMFGSTFVEPRTVGTVGAGQLISCPARTTAT